MVVEAYIGQTFDYPHEREAADVLLKAMQSRFHSRPEAYFLLQNVSINGSQIDFIVLKPKAIIVIELKEIPNAFTASENGDWESGDKVFTTSGDNPYHQVMKYRNKFIDYCEKNEKRINNQNNINFRHTTSYVCISPAIHKDSQLNIDTSSSPKFKLVGLDEVVEKIDRQVSASLDMSEESLRKIIKLLNLTPAKNTLLQGSFFTGYRKNTNFIGRVKELKRIHEYLSVDENSSKTAVITGIGGVGKTSLCIQYSYEHRAEYPNGVYLINAAGDLIEEFAKVARQLGLRAAVDESGSNSEILARRFLKLINGTPDVLLVLDNLNDPKVLYKPILGEFIILDFLCRKLITTRDFPNEYSEVFRVKLKPFNTEEAIRYVSELLQVQPLEQDKSPSGQLIKEREQIKILCSFFGNHPYALNLAASAITSRRIKLDDFLTRLNAEGGIATLDAFKVVNIDTYVEYRISDLIEWHWEKFGLMTRKILGLFTLFPDSQQITKEGISRYLDQGYDSPPGYPDLFEDALNELTDLSLIQMMGFEKIVIHPLIKDFSKRKVKIIEEIKVEIAENLFKLYKSPSNLEKLVITAGISDVREDLRFCQTLLTKDQLEERFSLIKELYLILISDSSMLNDVMDDKLPGYIMQEIRNRAFDLGFHKISLVYEGDLSATDEPWLCKKYTSQDFIQGLVEEYRLDGNAVNCIALFKNDTRLISGSVGGKLNIWDVDNGYLLNSIETEFDIDSLKLSPSGDYVVVREMTGIAVGSRDGYELIDDPRIEIWNLYNKQRISRKPEDANETYQVISNSEVLFGNNNGVLITCKLSDGSELTRLKICESKILDIDSSSNLIVVLDNESKIFVYDKKNMRLIGNLSGPNRVFKDIKLIQNGRYLIGCFVNSNALVMSYGFDSKKYDWTNKNDLLVWDLKKMELVEHIHLEEQLADVLNETKEALADGLMDQTIHRFKLPELINTSSKGIWAVSNIINTVILISFPDLIKKYISLHSVSCFAVAESEELFLGEPDSAGDPFCVLFPDRNLIRPIIGHLRRVNQIIFSQDEKEVFSASDDGSVKKWDTEILKSSIANKDFIEIGSKETGEKYNPWDFTKVQSVGISKNELYVFTVTIWNEVQVRSLQTGKILFRKELNELENFQATSFTEAADSNGLIINGEDSALVWDYIRGTIERYYLPSQGQLKTCVQLKDGRLIGLIDMENAIIPTLDKQKSYFEIADLTHSVSLYEIDNSYNADIFSCENGGWLFYCDENNLIYCEDLMTRKKLVNLNSVKRTDEEAWKFYINDTGSHLCVTYFDGTKEIFNLEEGSLVTSRIFEDFFIEISLDNCFERAASSEYEGTFFWRLSEKKNLAKLSGITTIKLSGSGRYAAAIDKYGVLQVFELINI